MCVCTCILCVCISTLVGSCAYVCLCEQRPEMIVSGCLYHNLIYFFHVHFVSCLLCIYAHTHIICRIHLVLLVCICFSTDYLALNNQLGGSPMWKTVSLCPSIHLPVALRLRVRPFEISCHCWLVTWCCFRSGFSKVSLSFEILFLSHPSPHLLPHLATIPHICNFVFAFFLNG